MSNRIRKISINKRFEKDGQILDHSMNYIVGVHYKVFLEGETKPTQMPINNIEESESFYLIYLKNDDEIMLWKKEPKEGVGVEYDINA